MTSSDDPEHAPDAAALRDLSRAVGLDLAAYRRDHVLRQLERACLREQVDVNGLAVLAGRDPRVAARLRSAVAVSVSGLFRDPEQFEFLAEHVVPGLVARRGRLHVWSAGCADGTELLSLGLLLRGAGILDRSFLLGSDILSENVARARALMLEHPEVRSRVRIEIRDLLGQPPPGRFALVLCRNVLIYFEPASKRRALEGLASVLAAGGVLVLGRSERLLEASELGLRRLGDHAYSRDFS